MLNYKIILKVTEDFYDIAKKDILIGYHFRVIADFDVHIPRIADFWNLQLLGEIRDRNNFPFNLLKVHEALRVNIGELGRWKLLFKQVLDANLSSGNLTENDRALWLEKIDFFEKRIRTYLFA